MRKHIAAIALHLAAFGMPLIVWADQEASPLREEFANPALPSWTRSSEKLAVEVSGGKGILRSDPWSYLLSRNTYEHVSTCLRFTVLEPARSFHSGGYGGDWNAYRYHAYDDGGYEVGVLLRAQGEKSGYRVQLSTKYQEISLLKYPFGSFLEIAPCPITVNVPHELAITVQGNEIVARVDGKELIRYADHLLPLEKGAFGFGVGSSSKVAFEDVKADALPAKAAVPEVAHHPDFRIREWRGQKWIFDQREPILLLFHAGNSWNQNVKLKPGYRPGLAWNVVWDIACQGSYPEGAASFTEAVMGKEGETLELSWEGKQTKGCFVTHSRMTTSYDPRRKTYVYETESSIDLLKDFNFRQGYDFEHHEPLGPFSSKFLVLRNHDGKYYYRPVYPIDPGPCNNVAKQGGMKMWYGRTDEPLVMASPAVEYDLPELEKREANTAVCACMYDSGVGFGPETAKAGTKIAVRFRYTGYPPDEAQAIWKASTVYPSPTLDPNRHLIFAGYPKTTFADFLPLDQPWWGRHPFVTAHNCLPPHYYLEKNTGHGNGYAMKLAPGGICAASLPTPAGRLPKGKYLVTIDVKGDNLHGPGGTVSVLVTDQQLLHGYTGGHVRGATKVLKEEKHFVGNGSFDWRPTGFVTELPSEAPAIAIELGNSGTGTLWFTNLEIRPIGEGEMLPAGMVKAGLEAPALQVAPAGALADYRMEEGSGTYVHDYAGGFGPLELSNVEWVKDGARPVLELADYVEGRSTPASPESHIGLSLYSSKNCPAASRAVFALGGLSYSSADRRTFSLCVETKPARNMCRKPGYWGTDIAGLGARAVKLVINNQGKLTIAIHFKEYIPTEVTLEPDQWVHLALVGESKDGEKMSLRLYVNGKLVKEAVSQHFSAIPMSNHIILGAELYYLDGAYYRGRFGRVTVYDRPLREEEVVELAKAVK